MASGSRADLSRCCSATPPAFACKPPGTLASPVIGPGCGGIAVGGEQVEERADPVSFLGGVPEQVVAVHGVPGAAAGAGAGEVARGFKVGHDDLDGAFGEVDGGADVADPGGGVAGDLHQHVPVPGQQCPAAAALVSNTHTR